MAITIKTPKQVALEYLDHLKALRPEINTDQQDSDWWIRAQVEGGVLSGLYSDLNNVSNDAFPQTARREAIDKELEVYFGSGLRQPTQSNGLIAVTGPVSGTIAIATQFYHPQSGNTYQSSSSVTLASATGLVPIVSIAAGQAQNLVAGASVKFASAPPGFTAAATVQFPGITDGKDEESATDGANRVLARIRQPSRGGTAGDYEQWALEADARVTSAKTVRQPYGLGTVQVIITAGTNNIDVAIDNDLPVIITPSDDLRGVVRDYIDALNPINDLVFVDSPLSRVVDIDVQVTWVNGDQNSFVAGTTITQKQALIREIQRAIYKTPVGGRNVQSAIGYMRAADIEEAIDSSLSSAPYTEGLKYQIVADRQITLAGGAPNIALSSAEAPVPGTITVTDIN